ncbi:hypothetical protein PLIP_a3805 [Pseudoalteromonas lipolytica LMEB 39]|nr:hypothetical protein [Pseudoalteromonas lipolytica LMEB 39]
METVSSIDPVLAKVIGLAVLCWFSGFGAGKVFHFVAEIFKKASRTH